VRVLKRLLELLVLRPLRHDLIVGEHVLGHVEWCEKFRDICAFSKVREARQHVVQKGVNKLTVALLQRVLQLIQIALIGVNVFDHKDGDKVEDALRRLFDRLVPHVNIMIFRKVFENIVERLEQLLRGFLIWSVEPSQSPREECFASLLSVVLVRTEENRIQKSKKQGYYQR